MNAASGSDKSLIDPSERIVPRATYRLQLRREFNFQSVTKILPYLSGLGISHLYLSPIFQARPGSTYGYDVTDHSAINSELGTIDEFKQLSLAARAHGLGIILDIVPNHMAVMTKDNEWWFDVLENGPAARFSQYFDIDWQPLRESMRNRLLVPILENRYGDELNAGRISVAFDKPRGSFCVFYNDHCFPIDPLCYPHFLSHVDGIDTTSFDGLEFLSIVDEFGRLPNRYDTLPEYSARRYLDKEVLKHRLANLCARNEAISKRIDAAIAVLNGRPDDPRSLDRLAALLDAQPYRLAYWKVAGDEINYRRFFDVNQLAALRAERDEVFNATHRLVFELLAGRFIDGLRIDHIDGLHDPHKYLTELRRRSSEAGERHVYILVEKILAAHERLRDDWPIEGTTGYEFNSLITQWLTSERGVTHHEWIYRQFIRGQRDYATLVYESKKLLMRTSLAAEIAVLGVQLDRIAQAHRDTADFTHFALRDALTEVIAAFPVYRTYITHCGACNEDAQSISWAVGAARTRGKGSDRSIFDFIENVLLCKPTTSTDPERHAAIVDFTRKFQQVTAPVMAKSVEDTAFYRYLRLLAANEVGGDPRAAGISNATFHRINSERSRRWPHSMLATSTHDSKRGEDVRYRLCALTELPKLWRNFSSKASRLNRSKHVDLESETAPTRSDEYLLLQTIVGMWPTRIEDDVGVTIARLKEYMVKAMREAKEKTSWIDPDHAYESACLEFIEGYVTKPRRKRFLTLVKEIVEPLAFFGALNALTASTLKITLPGVPDFYQGSELEELSLVDPDNRRSVDFQRRATLCERFLNENAGDRMLRYSDSMNRWRDGELKAFVVWKLLQLRRSHVRLLSDGAYEPLEVHGPRAAHVCAFARVLHGEGIVVIVSRWAATLTDGEVAMPLGEKIWEGTRVTLPPGLQLGEISNVFAELTLSPTAISDNGELKVSDAFVHLPLAVLYWRSDLRNSVRTSPSRGT